MGENEAVVGPERGWNTWTELILAAAVMRHGHHRWHVVVSELRNRAPFPDLFTPEVCKTKYKEMKKYYSGSRAWFEELRKQFVAELKEELARSEASIGILESQVKYLETQKNDPNYGWIRITSPLATLKSVGSEPSSQNTSKNEQSAGSYTKGPGGKMSMPCKHHDQKMETDMEPGLSVSSEHDKDLGIQKWAEAGDEVIARKRRGQRKRKDCNEAVAEGSVGKSDNLCLSDADSTSRKEAITPDSNQNSNSPVEDDSASADSVKTNNLMEIFQCIAQSEPALVFKHRMYSQKQTRYRKIIRHHIDIGMIRTRIISKSIKSEKQLFRDLLLLASNALVFYSRKMREYRSALSLRHLIMKEYKQQCRGSCHEATPAFLLFNPPVRPRTARRRPCKEKQAQKCSNNENMMFP